MTPFVQQKSISERYFVVELLVVSAMPHTSFRPKLFCFKLSNNRLLSQQSTWAMQVLGPGILHVGDNIMIQSALTLTASRQHQSLSKEQARVIKIFFSCQDILVCSPFNHGTTFITAAKIYLTTIILDKTTPQYVRWDTTKYYSIFHLARKTSGGHEYGY